MRNKVGEFQAIRLNTDGFEELSEQQKQLAYHLTQAGLAGSKIALRQTSIYNRPIIEFFIDLYKKTKKTSVSNDISENIRESLFLLFLHSGIYHHTSGEKIQLKIHDETLNFMIENSTKEDFNLFLKAFSSSVPNFQTLQNNDQDVVLHSGIGFYPENTHRSEIEDLTLKLRMDLSETEERSPYLFNTIISRDANNDLNVDRIFASEKATEFSQDCVDIIKHLKNALEFCENEKQKLSIETLITFYLTGDPVDFDTHCVAWTQDQDSSIYFVNGLIESYDDPLGNICTFESLVAFKNPNDVKRVQSIIDNIQWFEDHLPIDPKFKKDKAQGLSASSINVISMSGKTSPCLPLGINLPNSDWIRSKHGSKSVTLSNVSNSRSDVENPLISEMYLPEYIDNLKKYENLSKNLHIDLHEIAGHGSGKTLPSVSKSDLSIYYSVIEECRADLVALYYAADPKLEEFGIYPLGTTKNIATARYVSYITEGLMSQLRRVKLGNDLTQAHLRNRQLISSFVLKNSLESDISIISKNGKSYIKLENLDNVRNKIGELLIEIQRVKSTGDFEAAKKLVETYGTKINIQMHKEILDRVSKLNMPELVGYISPILYKDENGNIKTEIINDFVEQQIKLW